MQKTKEEILAKINAFPMVNIWSHPKRPNCTQINECEHCGRKLGKDPIYVHINTEGTILPIDITEEDLELVDMESQGCFPLGSGCAKKLFGKLLPLYNNNEKFK